MSSEQHNLKGTRFERMEKEVQRMLTKKRPRDQEDSSDARPHKREQSGQRRPKASTGTGPKKLRASKPSEGSAPSTKRAAVASSSEKPVRTAAAPVAAAPSNVPAAAKGLTNDRTVYIQGLPFSCDESDVRSFFAEAGTIESVRLPKWHDSGKLKGYGHVAFATAEDAVRALELSGSYLKDRFITVDRPMVPRALATAGEDEDSKKSLAEKVANKPPGCKTIFIRNLPYEVTEAEIREKFMVYGPIVKVRLAVWNHTSNLKGFGYIDYKREDSADIAVKKSGDVQLQGRIITVDYESGAPKAGYKGDKVLNSGKKDTYTGKK